MAQSPADEQQQLWEELDVNTMWVHVLRGTPLDDMGMNAIAVYVMLKTYTSLESGIAFPSIPTLAKRLQTSEDTVSRALSRLLELNVLEKTKVGRKNHYRFIESLPLHTRVDDLPVARVEMPYIPLQLQSMLAQIKEYAKTGASPGSGINISFNVTVVTGENATVNVQNLSVGSMGLSKGSVTNIIADVRKMLKSSADLKPRRG